MPGTHPVLVSAGAILFSGALWYLLSLGSNQIPATVNPPELVFERVAMDRQNRVTPKKLVVRPLPPKPKPLPPPPVHEKVTPTPTPPKPEGAHNRVLAVKPTVHAPAPDAFSAPKGGNAPVEVPTSGQKQGNATVNPPAPTPAPVPTPAPQPAPEPKHEEPAPAPTPPPVPTPAPPPPPPPPPPTPPPAPPPKPKGETKEAVASHQVSVEIPESLKSQSFKSFVRVRVSISTDGSFEVTLRTSSGNADVDKLVLDALNRWKWQPALKDGDPVDSVQLFRFNFSVQ